MRDAEVRYGALIGNSSDLIFEFDSNGRLVFLSPNCSSLVSRPLDEVLGKTVEESGILESLHPEDREPLFEAFRHVIKTEEEARNRFRLCGLDGSWRCFEGVSTFCRQVEGSRRVLSICRDVTEVVQARQDHQESEELYRIVTDVSRDMIIEIDTAGRLAFANRSVEEITGYGKSDLIGKEYISFFDLVHPNDRERIVRQYEEQSGEPGDTVHYPPYRFRHKDGSWIWFSTIGTWYEKASGEIRMLEVSRDISREIEREAERIETARQMLERQKLESLGVMAGGITHDFNNLLTPILGDAQLALLDLPPDSPVRPHVAQIHHAAKRAAALTRQMLAYSGQSPVSIEPVSVSRLVEEMGQLLEGTISGKAALIYDLPDDLPAVEGDIAQLSQVLMNLITNATEAIREGAGRITLRAGTVEAEKIDRSRVIGDCEPIPGRYVFFEVVDDGCGMDAETQSKIFDPFFTTKFTGRGLGLAAVVGIVRSHGGMIEIDSEVGRGTRFRVLFPAAQQIAVFPTPEETLPVEQWHASSTVLVVDDDEGVRNLLAETLRRVGLTVLLASDGREGVDLFRLHADEIRAVVLDRTMPDIGGEDAFDEIRRIRPDARIMLISGYSEERAAWHFIDKGLDAFMHKPFEPAVFLEKIRRIIDRGWDPNA
ncbi:MAG: PAS domain S-box protein [Deltaproteobacteria bacterium]|nr:PAS domain S-box protein [Deltaproteobacteria bacterium]